MISFIKSITPEFLLRIYFKYKWRWKKRLNHLTTQQIFSKIYSEKTWGKEGSFCSGPGSTTSNVKEYIKFLIKFIEENSIKNIVDLGCGDYRVMKEVVENDSGLNFIGVDIVPQLINHNQNTYGNDRIKFVCLDAINDELPEGELIVIRQVLQHLSNFQIQQILKKAHKYKYILISEHLPVERITVNVDKPAGHENRLFFNSGIFINKPPFSLDAKPVFEFKDTKYRDLKNIERESVIRTYFIKN